MSFEMSAIRLMLLIVSFYGYMQYFSKKVRPELSIGIIFAGIGSVMFLAGILNVLPEAAILIFIGGMYFAVRSVVKKEKFSDLLSVGTVFFAIMCVCFIFLLRGSKFVHYDNFSHWAISTKVLISQDRFPNFQDINIAFQSYPLGNASFIYYITKIIGIKSEWIQMYSQAILMTGMVAGIFSFAKKTAGYILAAVTAVALLCANNNFVDLLVDTLLPLVAVAAMAFIIYYKDNLHSKIWGVIPYTLFLVSIKNSGLFFVAIILMCLLIYVIKRKENFGVLAINLLCPAVLLLLWQKHVDLVFSSGLTSKHSMSVENFEGVFSAKSSSDFRVIFGGIIDKMFSLSNGLIYILISMVMVTLIFRFAFRKNCKEIMGIFVFSICCYVGYQIGTLGMYLFTMPGEEALSLAGYDRYHQTIIVFVVGVVCIGILRELSILFGDLKARIIVKAVSVLCVVSFCLAVKPDISYYKKQDLKGTQRAAYDQLIEEYDIPSDSSYIVLVKAGYTDSGYLYYLSKYLLNPSNVSVVPVNKLVGKDVRSLGYKYLIVLDTTDEVREFVEQEFGSGDLRMIKLGA